MEQTIKCRKLEDKEISEILNLVSDDITGNKLEEYFAYTKKRKARFSPQDYFVLPANKCYNDKAESTTIGRYIFNRFLLTEKLGNLIKYMNYPMNGSAIDSLNNKIGTYFLEDKIDSNDVNEYFNKMNWIEFYMAKFMNASLAAEFVMTHPDIKKKKDKLVNENLNEIKNCNMKVASDIEGELISDAKQIFKDHPSMQIYDSGARGSFGNNYKNTSIMRGIVKDFADPSKAYISTTNLDEGFTPDEFKYYSDISTAGTYSKAVETQQGGYQNKIMTMSFQSTVLDEKDSDCGSKLYYKFILTDKNYNNYKYRIIKDGNRLVELNDENKSKFMNKVVEMRSPLYCKGDKICNKCAGNYFYNLGIENVGLLTNRIGGVILNAGMKSFHDSTVHIKTIDIEDYISD